MAAGQPVIRPVSGISARRRDLASARRRLWTDRGAALVIRVGGLAVVASILAIFVFLLVEIWPLVRGAHVSPGPPVELAEGAAALLVDEHRTHAALLAGSGRLWVVRLDTGDTVVERQLPSLASALADPFGSALAGSDGRGGVILAPVAFRIRFDGQDRVVEPVLGDALRLAVDASGGALGVFTARYDSDRATAVGQLADGRLAAVRRSAEVNPFSGELTESIERIPLPAAPPLTQLVLDPAQEILYAGTEDGALLWWRLGGTSGEAPAAGVARAGQAPITALSLLIGGRSLVVGQQDGSLSIWFLTPDAQGHPTLTRVRDFPSHAGAVDLLAPSERDRSFLAQDDAGTLGLYYSTSHRTLWREPSPLPGAQTIRFTPKGDGALLASAGTLLPLEIDNPHPEISLEALFGKVWYEGFSEPQWIWQSSSGDDEFEAKLGLTPLISGTLKGTFYALLLAIPLGVLGAMYTSQFMHPRFQRVVKPTVEIMAALPSVVLGFLAGLWLAPRLERYLPALILILLAIPLLSIGAGWCWERMPKRWRGRLPDGAEVLWMGVVLAAGMALCLFASAPFEQLAFGGSVPAWIERVTGLRYDQRNAIVVGIAMGFAVIPIIFAIAEDAFSNVPPDLAAGSRALGANRWQTVIRVVLPTASPGIFSAIMIGFGRAVGETMIVLMATGNTPIMGWSPFDGFRTLSANIAVEIPEAPHGGTLYRTLFVAALLLFALTFLVNTGAELVRHRLRKRYARL